MRTRKSTSDATKACRKRHSDEMRSSRRITKSAASKRIRRNDRRRRERTVPRKTARLTGSAAIPAGTRKSQGNSAVEKEEPKKESNFSPIRTRGSERILAVEEKKQPKNDTAFSPIKTRGLCKKQVRGTEHCRLCKTNAGDFMACTVCQTKYHLKCLGYTSESARLVFDKRFYTWLCPACTYCCSCNEIIYDPGNVQCFACDRAFHEWCRPSSGIWANPKYPLSDWFCPGCKHFLESRKREQSENTPSSSISSHLENETSERKSRSTRKKPDYTQACMWKVKLQAERDAINDQQKDLCREYLEEKERREKEEIKRQIERENFSPKKKIKPSARNTKKIKQCNSEFEVAENAETIHCINGVKFAVAKKQGVSEEISEAENLRKMKEKSSAFDFNLYMAARREFLKFQQSEEMNADEEIPPGTQWVQFGNKRLLALYPSAYPKHIAQLSSIYVCRFCLTALVDSTMYEMHMAHCEWQHPPGNEIYRDNDLSFWEIDGLNEINYCRRLCLLSKLFLFSKTLHHEVETFLFYILTERTSEGFVPLGYFSKEKNPYKNNNLSCLLTLPSSQRTGYGKLLIDLSYKLSLRERKIGGPEHPLSDMGLITYRSYWKAVIISYIRARRPTGSVSVKEMSNETGIHTTDIISTMLVNKLLKYRDGNYFINKKKAFTAPLHTFRRRVVHDEKLVWEPEFDVDEERIGTYID